MPRTSTKTPPPDADPPEQHFHMHGPSQPYIVFTDAEGMPHFMEFARIHLYCNRGHHFVQDGHGRHYEVSGSYDVMDPERALQTYQMMCAAVTAAANAKES